MGDASEGDLWNSLRQTARHGRRAKARACGSGAQHACRSWMAAAQATGRGRLAYDNSWRPRCCWHALVATPGGPAGPRGALPCTRAAVPDTASLVPNNLPLSSSTTAELR
eukprot:1082-Chlamydomonas_euryale.AAC.3